MSPVVEYIMTLPVSDAVKWFCVVLALSDRKIFTYSWLAEHTNYSRRMVRHFMYPLRDCGVISKREIEGAEHHYFISDTRLIHHIAAEKEGFEPINNHNKEEE